MAGRAGNERAEQVRDAMNRVMAAEREAESAVNDARRQARDALSQARETAHEIDERARTRTGRIHEACEERANARARELRDAAGMVGSDPDATRRETELVLEACRRLAADLTSRQ